MKKNVIVRSVRIREDGSSSWCRSNIFGEIMWGWYSEFNRVGCFIGRRNEFFW